jgi:Ca2+/Na+ antiporter
MGITIIAAGTTTPDVLGSLAVARQGHGDMAISSSIGSNVFDILIGLPLPWFISSAFVEGGAPSKITSEGEPRTAARSRAKPREAARSRNAAAARAALRGKLVAASV